MITIQELLYNRGLGKDWRVKLVRHKSADIDLLDLYRRAPADFALYQSLQKNDVFKDVDYIASFVGEAERRARFVGVWKIIGKSVAARETKIGGSVFRDNFHYQMEEVEWFEDLKDRAIVIWDTPRSWHQWFSNDMEVVEISPGVGYRRLCDYADIVLSFPELCDIINSSYSDWKLCLSAIKGIYLITDMNTGQLYVGSAYGENGIWGRWYDYVSTNGHGGNIALKEVLDGDCGYAAKYFQFSILMIFPKTITADEIVRKEQLFKRKLGSNSHGLNKN